MFLKPQVNKQTMKHLNIVIPHSGRWQHALGHHWRHT